MTAQCQRGRESQKVLIRRYNTMLFMSFHGILLTIRKTLNNGRLILWAWSHSEASLTAWVHCLCLCTTTCPLEQQQQQKPDWWQHVSRLGHYSSLRAWRRWFARRRKFPLDSSQNANVVFLLTVSWSKKCKNFSWRINNKYYISGYIMKMSLWPLSGSARHQSFF